MEDENIDEKINLGTESGNENGGESTEPKTYSQAEVDEMLNQKAKEYEESFDQKFNERWSRAKRKEDKDSKDEKELIKLLKEQTGKENTRDLLELSYEQYKVERPSRTDEDEVRLGKLDAQELLSLDKDEIEEEAERLSHLKRNAREEATFLELARYLTEEKEKTKRKKEIQEAGIDDEVVNSDEFKNLLSKFNDSTPIKDVYEVYQKMYEKKEEKPYSAGSLKSSKENDDGLKDFYTYEESRQFSREDYRKNPKLLARVKESMTSWGKKK